MSLNGGLYFTCPRQFLMDYLVTDLRSLSDMFPGQNLVRRHVKCITTTLISAKTFIVVRFEK